MKRSIVLICSVISMAVPSTQAATASSAPAMVKMLSYSALTGLKLAARPAADDTEEDVAIKKCVQSLESTAFDDVIDAFLVRRFNKTELASMEEFMSSSAGIKYAKNRILTGLSQVSELQHETLAALTPNDIKEIQRFLASTLGQRLSSPNGLWDDDAEKAITARSQELFNKCVP